jgi:hypothetical protein
MTKEECVKILAVLGSFYGGGKTDPKSQVNAWFRILEKYPYEIADKAVFKFAENDVRDYATFPAVGKIVKAIREEEKTRNAPIKEILMSVSYGHEYDALSDGAKALIDCETYGTWLSVDAEEFASNMPAYTTALIGRQGRLLESEGSNG